MPTLTRREWAHPIAGAALGAAVAPLRALQRLDSKISGVQIGIQSYSFRDRPLAAAIDAMKTVGLSSCELWQDHIETAEAIGARDRAASRDALRQWRLTVPLETFRTVRRRFDVAGIALTAYNLSFRDDFTDEEINRGFEMATALGVNVITASSNVATAPRLDPFARRHQIRVAFHNHSNVRANEFATPNDFATALKGASDMLAINLDIGHFTAANFDALAFLDSHHERIVSLHVKDRKRDQGENVPFGQGDTPIAPVLQRLRDRKWAIPANIEYEYKGTDTVDEVRRCLEYCRQTLA